MQSRREKTTKPPPGSERRLRIIAGRWRGRRWQFIAAPGVRPTPDRVRETLFNWVAPQIAGSRCLDLFAGSGALGLEALSRGAEQVVFLDHDESVLARIQQVLNLWQASSYRLEKDDALAWLAKPPQSAFDLVFVDPPFAAQLIPAVLQRLCQRGWLAPGGQIYLETARTDVSAELPENWSARRSGHAGAVSYYLLHETPRALPGNL